MSTAGILAAQKNIARYGLSTLLVLGNFGNVFTILILGRTTKQRVNSCSLYLLSASISNWIVINTALVSNIVGVDNIDPQHTSNVVCKMRWSGVHALLMLSRSFSKFIEDCFHLYCLHIVVAACIDRWALCSQNGLIRSFARPKVAFRVIVMLLVVWTLIPIHMAVFFSNNTGRCIALPGTYAFFYAIYSLIVIGILPLLLMIIFSLLAWYNLQKIRSRVAPMGGAAAARNINIHKRDRDLMLMLTGEVIVYCITTIPYPINLIYSVSTSSLGIYKDPMRIAIESLVGYIISPLLNFMYCVAQFYGKTKSSHVGRGHTIFFIVYAACCARFRMDFVNLIRCRPVGGEAPEAVTKSTVQSRRQ